VLGLGAEGWRRELWVTYAGICDGGVDEGGYADEEEVCKCDGYRW